MTAPTARCGTRSGYERHIRRGEEACAPCKEAAAAYRRNRYQSVPEERAYSRAWSSARQHAARRYADDHPVEWLELLAKELKRQGLDTSRVQNRAWKAALKAAEETRTHETDPQGNTP